MVLSLLVVLFLGADTAFAQGRGFVGGGVIGSAQGSETPVGSVGFPTSGVGGFSIGGNVEVGVDLASRIGLLLEAIAPLPFESDQVNVRLSGSYQQTTGTVTNHTDIVFSELLSWKTQLSERAEIAVLFGPSLVREHSTSQTVTRYTGVTAAAPPVADSIGSEMDLSRWTFGVTSGVSLAWKIRPRLEGVPLVRVHWIERETNLSFPTGNVALLGLAPVVVRFGVGLRFRF